MVFLSSFFLIVNSHVFSFQPLLLFLKVFGCALHLVPQYIDCCVRKITIHKLLLEHLNLISLPHSGQK